MNKSFLLLLLPGIFSCTRLPESVESSEGIADNEELQQLYDKDQSDRQSGNIDWYVVAKRDSLRQARVYQLLDSGKVQTSKDYSNAAIIFQHGNDTVASAMAVKMMRQAIALDSTANKWLLAAAIDRDLMRRGKPQIYGTQYRRMRDEPWKLYEIDTTVISDAERMEYGVETLAQQREKLRMMNKKKLSELLVEEVSIDKIISFCNSENLRDSEYDLSERGINTFGYQLLAEERNEEALKIFELNTILYPDGFNTYDSYGECLLKLGQRESAIRAYEKSLDLNPKNDNAKRMLTEIQG